MNQEHVQAALVAAVQYLKAKGVVKTNQQIADAVGYSKGIFSSYLSGSAATSENFVLKFKEVFGIDLTGEIKSPVTGVVPGEVFERILGLEAYTKVLLEMVSEVLARQINSPVTTVLNHAKKSVQNRLGESQDELRSRADQGE